MVVAKLVVLFFETNLPGRTHTPEGPQVNGHMAAVVSVAGMCPYRAMVYVTPCLNQNFIPINCFAHHPHT